MVGKQSSGKHAGGRRYHKRVRGLRACRRNGVFPWVLKPPGWLTSLSFLQGKAWGVRRCEALPITHVFFLRMVLVGSSL